MASQYPSDACGRGGERGCLTQGRVWLWLQGMPSISAAAEGGQGEGEAVEEEEEEEEIVEEVRVGEWERGVLGV